LKKGLDLYQAMAAAEETWFFSFSLGFSILLPFLSCFSHFTSFFPFIVSCVFIPLTYW
jgi:hypothetical protein